MVVYVSSIPKIVILTFSDVILGHRNFGQIYYLATCFSCSEDIHGNGLIVSDFDRETVLDSFLSDLQKVDLFKIYLHHH